MEEAEMDNWYEKYCSVESPEWLRMVMVAFIGTAIASVSLLFNFFLFLLLISNPRYRRTPQLYLIFLSLIDSFLSGAYILLFPVNLFMDFFESELLAWAWWNYMRPILVVSHICITSSALLLCAATFERFVTISKIRSQFAQKHRLMITGAVILSGLIAKGPMFFELRVVPNENCTGVTAFRAEINEWTKEEPYKTICKFGFQTVVSTFLPFFLSLHFNFRIVSRLRQQHSGARLFRFATSEHRKNVRGATRMLVLISSTYIGCNTLSVILSAWEFVDGDSLRTEDIRPFYTYSSDLISLLTVVSCATRLPIYYVCNRRLRKEVNSQLQRVFCCEGDSDGRRLSRDNTHVATMRYLNTGNGFVLYGGRSDRPKCTVGTGIDKVVLQVAMGEWSEHYATRRSFRTPQ